MDASANYWVVGGDSVRNVARPGEIYPVDPNQATIQEHTLTPGAASRTNQEEQEESPLSEVRGSLPEQVGGSITKPAFCLLDGVVILDNEYQPVQIPIACLPATLGRQHPTDDENFVPLGRLRALSRQMLRIEYRTKDGTVEHDDSGFTFHKDKIKPEFIAPEPTTDEAFFSVTSLGKNSITVNGRRLVQGQSTRLLSGDAIRISCFYLYFLLPKQAPSETIEIATAASPKKKTSTTKKRPASTSGLSTATPAVVSKKKKSKTTSSSTTSWPNLQAELDHMPTENLVQQLNEAIETDTWERRHQLIGSTLSYRAVLGCANNPENQKEAFEHGGMSRGDIMKWIAESDEFGDWSVVMQKKLEDKSYIASITKALLKAGYERTANSGRYIKWTLPEDVMKAYGDAHPNREVSKTTVAKKQDEDEDGDDDDDSGDDDEQDRGNDQGHDEDLDEDGDREHAESNDGDSGGDEDASL